MSRQEATAMWSEIIQVKRSLVCFPVIQVDRQAQFIQGYRVMYRPKNSAWLVQDVKSPTERSTVLVELHKGQEYELKIRPYFDEFQGMDSEVLLVRTPEEGTH